MASLPPEVVYAIYMNQVRSWNLVGGISLFVYDNLLTLDREYMYIWKAKWTLGKFIYICSRYHWTIFAALTLGDYTFGLNNSPKYCFRMNYANNVLGTIEMGLVQLTMALRTSAIYEHRTWVVRLLSVLFVACYGTFVTMSYLWLTHVQVIPNPLPGALIGCLGICIECGIFVHTWWIPIVLLDFVMFALTVAVTFRYARGGIYSTRLLDLLYRDGLLYFFVILGLEIVQLIMFNVIPLGENGAGLAIAGTFSASYWRAIAGIVCCRLILNLHGVLNQPSLFEETLNSLAHAEVETGTSIKFAVPTIDSTASGSGHPSYGSSTKPTSDPVVETGFEQAPESYALSTLR